MLKKVIEYTDFNGMDRKDTFYFNLSKAELAERELMTPGGYSAMLQHIVETQDRAELVRLFKNLIIETYGEKDAEGKMFVKSPEKSAAFVNSAAYSALFMELISSEQAAYEFMNGILPADISKQVDIEKAKREAKKMIDGESDEDSADE